MMILTQKPKLLEISWFVVMLADVQLVMSIPTYMEARHIYKCHLGQFQLSVYGAKLAA
jgi:hypothetical protein